MESKQSEPTTNPAPWRVSGDSDRQVLDADGYLVFEVAECTPINAAHRITHRIVAAVNAAALTVTREQILEGANKGMAVNLAALKAERDALREALAAIVEAATGAYKAGRIPAEPFVRANNLLAGR